MTLSEVRISSLVYKLDYPSEQNSKFIVTIIPRLIVSNYQAALNWHEGEKIAESQEIVHINNMHGTLNKISYNNNGDNIHLSSFVYEFDAKYSLIIHLRASGQKSDEIMNILEDKLHSFQLDETELTRQVIAYNKRLDDFLNNFDDTND